jgi:demethylmenaquinone methyltransferase/2-methoxy-6-polyprenyl-1,4-benzoquinol methylase
MLNKYYDPGEKRAERVKDLFGAIAPRYDLINDLQSFGLHRWWKRRVLALAAPASGEWALDLCCGTGDVAFGLAKRGANVVGLDFSLPMLSVARRRRLDGEGKVNSPRSNGGPAFLRGDAQHVPFPDNAFDVVTVCYGLRNLSEWEQGLQEMMRVARPGGRLVVLDFGKPDNALWRRIYFAYLRVCVPLFGRLFCGDAQTHGYILESLKHYPAQNGVAAAMREAGCRDVSIISLLGCGMTINYGVKS